MEHLYRYINQIKSEGIKQYIRDEQKRMSEIDFDNITKSSALSYATNLCSRMSKIDDEEVIPNLLWMPYANEVFNPEEIMKRLNLCTPERGIVKLVSKIVESEPGELKKERWYGTPFKSEKIPDDFIAGLSKIMPTAEFPMGYPPVNNFIPKQLIEKKRVREGDEKPSIPKQIRENVWFK